MAGKAFSEVCKFKGKIIQNKLPTCVKWENFFVALPGLPSDSPNIQSPTIPQGTSNSAF